MRLLALFGPTGSGKTSIAIAIADLLRERGEDPAAISCDAIQVYRGLGVISGAPTPEERQRLEHRLAEFVDPREEFSAGRFAELAHREIDSLIAEGRRPILVGGTGLYLRAAVSEMALRPRVAPEVREEVEREVSERGPEALHAEIEPAAAAGIHPNDRLRVVRALELQRSGIAPPRSHEAGGELWTARPRVPTFLIGLTVAREELDARIDRRVDEMLARGATEQARAAADLGASRTARAALGFAQFLAGDADGVKVLHRRYARRQMTWMRRMQGVSTIDRTGRGDEDVAAEIVAQLSG